MHTFQRYMVTKEASSKSTRETTRKRKCCNARCRPKVNSAAASPLPELQNNEYLNTAENSDQVQQHAAIKQDPETLFNCLLTQATERLVIRLLPTK